MVTPFACPVCADEVADATLARHHTCAVIVSERHRLAPPPLDWSVRREDGRRAFLFDHETTRRVASNHVQETRKRGSRRRSAIKIDRQAARRKTHRCYLCEMPFAGPFHSGRKAHALTCSARAAKAAARVCGICVLPIPADEWLSLKFHRGSCQEEAHARMMQRMNDLTKRPGLPLAAASRRLRARGLF